MKMIWKKQKALPALFFLILVFCLYMPFENGARAASTTDAKSMYSYVLGDAVNYGIVAETFTLNGDAETNLAAKNLVPKSSQTGNNLTNDVQQGFLIGAIDTSTGHNFHIKGYEALVHCAPEYKNYISADDPKKITFCSDNCSTENINKKINAMLDHVSARSGELAGHAANAKIEENPYSQKYVLDLTDEADGIYYVNVDKDLYDGIMSQADKFQIQKKADQSIVFNVSAPGNLTMQKYSINNQGHRLPAQQRSRFQRNNPQHHLEFHRQWQHQSE